MIYKIKDYGNGNFTQISNDIARSKTLSISAKGLLLYMLSCKEDWNFTIQNLMRETNTKQTRLQSALEELKNEGYVSMEQGRNKKGKFGNSEWVVTEEPLNAIDKPFGT